MSTKNSFSRVAQWLLIIFILFVLASILLPTIGGVAESGHPTHAASDLAQIAKTYAAYSVSSNPPRNLQLPPGSTTHDAAFILAKYADLNDASMWFIPADDALGDATIPKSVITGDVNTATAPDPAFANIILSVVIAANVSTSAPSTTTPIAWTRGLQEDGTWDSHSPWAGKGGHIAFLDGHVSWYDKLDATNPNESLVVAPGWPDAGTATANITLALPPGAIILPAEPRHPANP